MIWRLKVCQQLRQSKRLQLLNISCCPQSPSHHLLLILNLSHAPCCGKLCFSTSSGTHYSKWVNQLLGREQSAFILSGYVFCHINEFRGLKKGSNKNQTPCTTSRNCMARIRMVVVKTSSFRIYVRLDPLTLWNPASASYHQFIQSCPLWGMQILIPEKGSGQGKQCLWTSEKAVLYLCSVKHLLCDHWPVI